MKRQRNAGFTLIEIMVTVVIISILSAIALPAYKDYVVRSRLTEAFSALSAAQPNAEQYWSNKRSYVGFAKANGLPDDTDNFAYTLPVATTSAYTILATGKGKMNGFSYSIDQSGTRATVTVGTGWTKNAATCWTGRKDGSCVN
jgi:type IV pilus assembly protein PilE